MREGGYLRYVNCAGQNTNSWWGNDPDNPCPQDRGWWSDASVSQTFTLPSDAKTLRWNVCTGCSYSSDGSYTYQYNARVSVKINGVYLVDHYQPPQAISTLEWDISKYAGQTVNLELIIEGDCNEWAHVMSNWVDVDGSVVGPNDAPIADADGLYIGNEGAPILFDASASFDLDGDALQYRWDFNNDETWDTIRLSDLTASYTRYDDWSGTAKV